MSSIYGNGLTDCKSKHCKKQDKHLNMFGYCWTCWDRMCREDNRMIEAGAKKLKTSYSLGELEPTFWNKIRAFFTGEKVYNPYNHFPCPYEVETGERVPECFRDKELEEAR